MARTTTRPETPDAVPESGTTRQARIDIIERRLEHPFGEGSREIPVRRPGMKLRIFNNGIDPGKAYRARHQLGWEPVRADQLACKPEEMGWQVSPDGYIVRGVRGEEVLMWMPETDHARIQAAKERRNLQTQGRGAHVRDAVAEAGAAEFGDEAGEYIRANYVGEVADTRVLEG